MLHDTNCAMWRYFDLEAVAQRVAAHQTGKANLQDGLWRAFFFYKWSEARKSK